MRFTNIALSGLLSTVTASAVEFGLKVESSNLSLNGKKLTGYHEGAGINYLFLLDEAEKVSYNETSQVIYNQPNPDYYQSFSIYQDVAILGVLGATPVTFENEYLQINGSADGFFACKNIQDPYNYSKELYALIYNPKEESKEDCSPVKVKKF